MAQFAPHARVSAETGTENMFSGSGNFNDPRKTNMGMRLYERMVILKHRMNRTHVSLQNVVQLYLSRERENNWEEDEERDMK